MHYSYTMSLIILFMHNRYQLTVEKKPNMQSVLWIRIQIRTLYLDPDPSIFKRLHYQF